MDSYYKHPGFPIKNEKGGFGRELQKRASEIKNFKNDWGD